MNTHDNLADLLIKLLPISDKVRLFFGYCIITYLCLLQMQLQLHNVGMTVGNKRSMMFTYT